MEKRIKIYNPQQKDELTRHLNKIHRMNTDITHHLAESIIQLLRYGEKYSVKIPKKEQLKQILTNTQFLLKEHSQMTHEFNDILGYFNPDRPNKFKTIPTN